MKTVKAAVVAATAFVNSHVKLEHIVNHKQMPLRPLVEEHVGSLVQSIMKVGLDNPLDVWGSDTEGKLMQLKDETKVPASFLIAGSHRREALRRIKAENPEKFNALFPEGVPVRLRVCPLSDALLLQLRENVQREDMEADQILPVLKHLTELGLKQNVIANRIGKSTAWVSMMLDVNRELGDEGAEEVAKGNLPVRAAVKAAKELKADRKAGKPTDAKAAVQKAKASQAEAKGDNAKRAKKRVSLKALYNRFTTLPPSKAGIGRRLQILEGIVQYALGESNKLPDEVKHEVEVPAPAKSKK